MVKQTKKKNNFKILMIVLVGFFIITSISGKKEGIGNGFGCTTGSCDPIIDEEGYFNYLGSDLIVCSGECEKCFATNQYCMPKYNDRCDYTHTGSYCQDSEDFICCKRILRSDPTLIRYSFMDIDHNNRYDFCISDDSLIREIVDNSFCEERHYCN